MHSYNFHQQSTLGLSALPYRHALLACSWLTLSPCCRFLELTGDYTVLLHVTLLFPDSLEEWPFGAGLPLLIATASSW
jgi:hypothetical protein